MWRALPLLMLAAMVTRVIVDPLWISLDAAINLQYGDLLLDGKTPYVDFVDTNPPIIFYLSAAPVLLARALDAHPIPVFTLLVVALVGCSVLTLASLLSRARASVSPAEARWLTTAWAGVSFLAWQCGHFGQREHLWVLAYVPFFVLRWARWTHRLTGCGASGDEMPGEYVLPVT